jgi:hypothetical protein
MPKHSGLAYPKLSFLEDILALRKGCAIKLLKPVSAIAEASTTLAFPMKLPFSDQR